MSRLGRAAAHAFTLLLLLTAYDAGAEKIYSLYRRGPRPYFGLRVNGGYAYPYQVKYARIPLSSKVVGPDGGISGLFHAPVSNLFYVEPQIEVYFNSLKTSGNITGQVAEEGITEAKLRTIGFRVPVFLGLSFDVGRPTRRLYIFAGPKFDFRLKTWFDPDKESDIFNGTTRNPLYGDYGVDLDASGGLGMSFGQFYIGAAYNWGICHITRSDYGAKRQLLAQLSLGFNFKPL